MTDTNTWLITGAARGMGIDIAKAALTAGHSVVATARNAAKVTEAIGEHENLLAVSLDITDPVAAQAAVDATIARFGGIDTLVNNAGTFQAGYFEEISDKAFRAQMDTNFFGPLNVTRAVLPVMRKQRSGHVITFSSTAGLVGVDFCSAYSASKFALEGWMETLQLDVEPFGITTTIVEPGFFRTELLVEGASTVWADLSIDEYADRTKQTIAGWQSMNGQQGGDPAKLAASLVTISDLEDKPLRWMAGADSVANAKSKAHDLLAQADAHLELSTNLDHEQHPEPPERRTPATPGVVVRSPDRPHRRGH
jgi:NAD(P)-dependent dehydrogenase (short-subunit alcohol dehydrogenase family)